MSRMDSYKVASFIDKGPFGQFHRHLVEFIPHKVIVKTKRAYRVVHMAVRSPRDNHTQIFQLERPSQKGIKFSSITFQFCMSML